MLLDSDDEEVESAFHIGRATATTKPSFVKDRRIPMPQHRHSKKKGHDKPTVHATSASQAENLGYVWERDGDNVGLCLAKSAMVDKAGSNVGTASTRCSVSEDVLAAWGSLGGWRDISI